MTVLFKVDYESYVEVTREADPEEEYSGEDTQTSHWVNGLNVVEDNSFHVGGAFTKDELKNADNKVFLVNVIYSTGDSFSHQDSGSIEFVECFLDIGKAEDLIDNIQRHALIGNGYNTSKKDYRKEYIKYLEDNGIMEKIKADPNFKEKDFNDYLEYRLYYLDEQEQLKITSTPWVGYFESISSVTAESLVADLKKNKPGFYH